MSPSSMLTSCEAVASALLSWPSLGAAPSRGLKLYFAHTRTHPHPHSHPRTQTNMSQHSKSVLPQKRKYWMTHARQQITTKEYTRAKKGRPADISKTSPGCVDKARCVVVCCDKMRFASCEALAMVNKSIVIHMEPFWRVCRQAGGRVGLNGTGVGMLGGAEQIVFRGDVWRDECHGGVSIVGHGRGPCEGGAS